MNSTRNLRTKKHHAAKWLGLGAWFFVGTLLLSRASARAADVVYVERNGTDPVSRDQVKETAQYLGLSVQVENVGGSPARSLVDALHHPELLAVVISADALPSLNDKIVFAWLQRASRSVPIMIADVNTGSDQDSLRTWSSGAVSGAENVELSGKRYWYSFQSTSDVTKQVGGIRLPVVGKGYLNHLLLDQDAEQLVRLGVEKDKREQPVFVRVEVAGRAVFLAAESHVVGPEATPDPYRQQALFAGLAAPMLFLHYAGGDRIWHSPAAYANFTIDDPWLREPYGHVDYHQLLEHAREHNYHASIAFIPWNYDRSQPEVAALFREHPDKLSICIHGNDHIHQEFGPLQSHPMPKQVENMRQALARMEQFRNQTHVDFDPVMVFPHSIAPVATFSELRRNHYIATINSLNVPSDASTPAGIDFALRSATLQFGDFPSVRRYSAETDIPRAQLAIDAYLGNPLFFYAHESFFSSGMGAFDETADLVNALQPGTKWTHTGAIIQHLFLEKLRFDGKYEVRLFSSHVQIENGHGRDAEYVMEKDENFSLAPTVLVDGNPVSYERLGDKLHLVLHIEEGGARAVEIRYADETNVENSPMLKGSLHAAAVRILSDFRDNAVSRTSLGRGFIKSYAASGKVWNRLFFVLAVLVLLLCLARYPARRWRFARLTKLNSTAASDV